MTYFLFFLLSLALSLPLAFPFLAIVSSFLRKVALFQANRDGYARFPLGVRCAWSCS